MSTKQSGKAVEIPARHHGRGIQDDPGGKSAQHTFTPQPHREAPRLHARHGRTTTGHACWLARRWVESGVRFGTVNSGGWDPRANIFKSLDNRLPEIDACLSSLIEDLDSRGLLDSTLVLCMGEFGRSPKVNKEAGRFYLMRRDIESATRHFEKAAEIMDTDFHAWAVLPSRYQALAEAAKRREAAKTMVSEAQGARQQDARNGADAAV